MPFPNAVTINKPYVGPTLRFQTVPEPSCLLITFSTAAGLVLRRKRASCLITDHLALIPLRWIVSKSGTVLRHRHCPPHEC